MGHIVLNSFENLLGQSLIEKIDEWRTQIDDNLSRPEAITKLIELGLSESSSKETRLDRPQRLIIWMLSEILKNQKGYEHKEDMKLIQNILYGGHFWALDMKFSFLNDDYDKPEDLRIVMDILDMWTFLESTYSNFSDEQKRKIKDETPISIFGETPRFIGFDGNDEWKYKSIADFLINRMSRYENFKDRPLNSHKRMIDHYRIMLSAFNLVKANLKGGDLSVDKFIIILKKPFNNKTTSSMK